MPATTAGSISTITSSAQSPFVNSSSLKRSPVSPDRAYGPAPLSEFPVIHVAICDTHPVAIEGLVTLLDSTDSFRVVAAAGCLEGVLHAASYASADLLILEKALGQQKLLDAMRELRKRESEIRVVVWGTAVAESEALHYLRAGAAGVTRKTAPLET